MAISTAIYGLAQWASLIMWPIDESRNSLLPVWPAAGVGFALVWLMTKRATASIPAALGILIGGTAVSFFYAADWTYILISPCLNALEAWIAVTLMRRGAGAEADLHHVKGVLWFFAVIIIATAIHGIGHGLINAIRFSDPMVGWQNLLIICLTSGMGILLFAPTIIIWLQGITTSEKNTAPIRWLELTIIVGITLALSSWFFVTTYPSGQLESHPLIFLFLPVAVLAAFRCGMHGATTVIAIVSFIALTTTVFGYGPFYCDDVFSSLYHLEIYLIVLGTASLLFAAMLADEKLAIAELQHHIKLERLLYNELDHRVRNNLQSLLALIQLTKKRSSTSNRVDQLADSLRGRVQAMSNVHDLLGSHSNESLDLHELILSVAPPETTNRIHCNGPKISVSQPYERALGMVFHELATNAIEHGVIQHPEGAIHIQWQRINPLAVHIQWTESLAQVSQTPSGNSSDMTTSSPPPQSQPQTPPHSGTGLTLVRNLCEYELGGTVELQFTQAGARHLLMLTLPTA